MKKTTEAKRSREGVSPDAISLLESDHVEVRAALEMLKGSSERAVEERETTRAEVALAIWTHMFIEETYFYPAFAEAAENEDDEARGIEARAEHDGAKTALMRLEACDPASVELRALAKVVYDLIDHHAGEEEDEMFPRARELLGKEKLAELGATMKARKEELMASGETPARPTDEPRDLDLHQAAE